MVAEPTCRSNSSQSCDRKYRQQQQQQQQQQHRQGRNATSWRRGSRHSNNRWKGYRDGTQRQHSR
eukprot:2058397-Alexandrium_andersonii.AAC.1